jgi:hypothetical protein
MLQSNEGTASCPLCHLLATVAEHKQSINIASGPKGASQMWPIKADRAPPKRLLPGHLAALRPAGPSRDRARPLLCAEEGGGGASGIGSSCVGGHAGGMRLAAAPLGGALGRRLRVAHKLGVLLQEQMDGWWWDQEQTRLLLLIIHSP